MLRNGGMTKKTTPPPQDLSASQSGRRIRQATALARSRGLAFVLLFICTGCTSTR